MHITDIILKKRNDGKLSREEIDYFIREYVDGTLPDYQISALLMAIWFRGMDEQETVDLTLSMAASGDHIDLSRIPGIKVDKHSTGGVADTTTLIAAPLVAACGGRVAKMSGRGLGHTGGTLDKLESIPGFSITQTMDGFIRTVTDCGLSVIGQTANLVPADKKLYALRDVTGTVDNVSLIASSIMSKKLASGSDAIILDVKTGSGAFMKSAEAAERLARVMVGIGRIAGRKTLALVTDMNQPLGNAIGNAVEVQEAIEILRGRHPGDLKTVSFALAAQMLIASRTRWALVVELNREREPRLDEVLLELDQAALDLILVEGFKEEHFPKIELRRSGLRRPLLFPEDDAIIAVASDAPLGDTGQLPQLDLNRPEEIAAFIVDYVAKESPVLTIPARTVTSCESPVPLKC